MRIVAAVVLGAVLLGGGEAFAAGVVSEREMFSNYLAARQAASEFDLTDAAKYYEKSLAADPNNTDLLSKAFIYNASAGDLAGATKLAKRVMVATPDNRLAQLVLVVDAIKHGRWADARALMKDNGGTQPGPTMLLLNAWAALGAGDSASALGLIKTLKDLGSTDAIADYHTALMLDQLGRTREADAAYQRALLDVGPAPRIVAAFGSFLERSGRGADAQKLYEKLESEDALLPIVKAGEARIAAGKKADSVVPDAKAGAAEAMFGIGSSLTDNATADLAILYLHSALYLRPELDLAKILLADRFETLRKYDDALDVYRSVDKSSVYYRIAAVQIGVDLARLKKFDEAAAQLKSLTASDPNDMESWTALGDVYRAMEKYDAAADAYSQAIKLAGTPTAKNWELFYARAVSEQQSDKWPEAEADLQTALQLSPNEPDVLNNLGYSWVEKKRNIPKALVMLEKARTLRPFDGYIVDSVGWAYYQLGQYDDAAKTLLNAVALVPGDSTINEHLGDAYWRVGKKLDAQFQWNHALAFASDDKAKASIEQKLASGLPAPEDQTRVAAH